MDNTRLKITQTRLNYNAFH